MPDFHVISLLQAEEDFNFSKFEQRAINSCLDVLTSMALNGDVEPVKANCNVILCDQITSAEYVYKIITGLHEMYPEDSFFDNCLVLKFDKNRV